MWCGVCAVGAVCDVRVLARRTHEQLVTTDADDTADLCGVCIRGWMGGYMDGWAVFTYGDG